jgi:transposase
LRDELETIYADTHFAALFSNRGQAAESPGRLAIVTVLQFTEGLSDRQAADAVRGRIDWKYLLGLALEVSGFGFSVLSEFRDRLLSAGQEQRLLDEVLERFRERGLLKERGKHRRQFVLHPGCRERADQRGRHPTDTAKMASVIPINTPVVRQGTSFWDRRLSRNLRKSLESVIRATPFASCSSF